MKRECASDRWQVGDRIANQYEIYQILGGEGKSGMGIVYICYDHEHKTLYALKTFQERYLLSEENQKLFKREALVWIKLGDYPSIVRAYLVLKLEQRLFIKLEYVVPDSQLRNTLTHYLGNLTLSEILGFSIQFCYGMEYIYSKGIDAHRDIKPDNIMITTDRTVKITDFGLAKAFQETRLEESIISSGQNPSLSIFQSKGKTICGTLPYMAPEQFDGCADRRSDVYSFGVVLYQMVTKGKFPFMGKTVQEYEKCHKNRKVPSIGSQLFPIIQRCLQRNPDRRYQNFVIIREQLQNILLKKTGKVIPPPEKVEAQQVESDLLTGASLYALGKSRAAISFFDKAIRLDSKDNVGCYLKGVALYEIGKYQEAISYFNKSIRLHSRHAEAWGSKGMTLVNLGKYRQALSCFDKAIELDPKSVENWVWKGVALFRLSKYQKALGCVHEALKLNPNLSEAHELKQITIAKLKE